MHARVNANSVFLSKDERNFSTFEMTSNFSTAEERPRNLMSMMRLFRISCKKNSREMPASGKPFFLPHLQYLYFEKQLKQLR